MQTLMMQSNSLYKVQDAAETVTAQDFKSGFVRQSDKSHTNHVMPTCVFYDCNIA